MAEEVKGVRQQRLHENANANVWGIENQNLNKIVKLLERQNFWYDVLVNEIPWSPVVTLWKLWMRSCEKKCLPNQTDFMKLELIPRMTLSKKRYFQTSKLGLGAKQHLRLEPWPGQRKNRAFFKIVIIFRISFCCLKYYSPFKQGWKTRGNAEGMTWNRPFVISEIVIRLRKEVGYREISASENCNFGIPFATFENSGI